MKLKQVFLLGAFLTISLSSLFAQLKGLRNKDNKWALMDGSGKIITGYIYNYIGKYDITYVGKTPVIITDAFREGYAPVSSNGKAGMIDSTGKLAIPLIYQECENFEKGKAQVFQKDKVGLIDKTGKLLIPCKYDLIQATEIDSIYIVSAKNKNSDQFQYSLISTAGTTLLPLQYDRIEESNPALRIELYKRVGFYSMSERKIIVPCKYDKALFFHDGLAAVCLENKWGFVDLTGKLVIPIQYNRVDYGFEGGHATVWLNGEKLIIEKPVP
ncbi:MAG: WG repeat-containing protein [Ferruginibacter sp.]|nr:WG repeat-containing protein [Ferruginibacter sp.]